MGVTIALAAMFSLCSDGERYWHLVRGICQRIANGITSMTTLAPMFFYAGLHSGRGRRRPKFYDSSMRENSAGCTESYGSGDDVTDRIRSLPVATVWPSFCGLGPRECLSNLYSVAVATGMGEREENWRHPLLRCIFGDSGPGLIGGVSNFPKACAYGLLVPLACAASLIFLVLLLRRQTA